MGQKLIVESKKYKGETLIISSRLPIELIKEIDNVSEQSGRTRNELVVMFLEYALENLEIKNGKEEK